MMESLKLLFFVIIFNLVCDLIFCAKAPPVKCQLIDVIEESDPYKRVLEPAFIKTKKCAGGIKVPSRYQCQPIRTQKEEFEFFDTHSLAHVTKVKHVPVACGEFCICHTGCGGEKPRDGICEPGLKWNPQSCSCKCNIAWQLGRNGARGKTKSVSFEHHVIALVILALFFLVCLLVIAICYRRRKTKRAHKYRFLPKVEWDEQNKKKLETYIDYIDGKSRSVKRKTICGCIPYNGKEENLELMACDQTDHGAVVANDNLTAEDCFNIGYIAFKKDQYDDMLTWLQKADEILQSTNSPERIGNVETVQLLEYLSCAYFLTGDSRNALKYKELRMNQLSSAGLNGQAMDGQDEGSSSDTVNVSNGNQERS